MRVTIGTHVGPSRVFFATAPAPATLVTPVPLAYNPIKGSSTASAWSKTDGILDTGVSSETDANYGLFRFFGAGTAGQTCQCQIVGWSKVVGFKVGATDAPLEFVPTVLADVTICLGATTGAAGGPVGTSNLYAASMTINASIGNAVINAAGGIPVLGLDLLASQELQLVPGPGTVSKVNALVQEF